GPAGPSGSGVDTPSAGANAPPEQELESSFEAPVATGRFVWIANPVSGRVAYINAETLEIETVLAGNGPTYVTALGSDDATAVINVGSQDATLLRVVTGGDVTAHTVKLAPNMNSWAVSPNARFAVAWTDARKVTGANATQGFQDLSIIDLAATPE